jgi:putative GTP pyrophosphokinase
VDVTDVIAMRIVSPFLDDVSEVLAALRQNFEIHDLDRKGAEYSVREFGYESVHCLLRVPQDLCDSFHLAGPFDCEVQLRTILQDAWAEVEHEIIYKNDYSPLGSSLQRKLAALNANLSLSDITFQEIRDYQRALQAELSTRRASFWERLHADLGDAPRDDSDGPRGQSGLEAEVAPGSFPGALDDSIGVLDAELLAAIRAHNAGDYSGAAAIYTRILNTSPPATAAAVLYMHRGMAMFAQGNHRAALDDFSKAIEMNPENSRAFFYRGTVYRVLGDSAAAERDFTTCVDIDPYRSDSLYQRSATRLTAGDLDGARSDCDAALTLEPESAILKQLSATIDERRKYGEENGR